MKGYKKSFSLFAGALIICSSIYACGIFGPSQEEVNDGSGDMTKEEELVLEKAIDERIRDDEDNDEPQEDPDKVESKWGPDSATAIRKYSLYYQYYKQSNYQMAYPYWRWMIFNAPKQSINLYIRGVNLVEFRMENAPEAKKKAYLDTLMMVYDKRIKYFNKKGYVLGRKGMNLFQLDRDQARRAYDILKKSIELEGNDSRNYVPYYFLQTAVKLKEDGEIDKDQLLKDYNKTMDIIKANLNSGSQGDWQGTKENVSNLMKPYLSCSDLIGKYKPLYKDNKKDIEKLKEFQKSLKDANCTKAPFYLKLTETILDNKPSAVIALSLARNWKEKNNNDKAIQFYKKAVNLEDDNKKAADHALSLAGIYKNQKENLVKAKEYAKKAISLYDKKGKAYLFLGELYVAGRSRCGDDFKKNAVLWAAVDQFKKAKEADPSVKEAANKRIESYTQRFPKKQPIFFRDLSEGDPYTVECWINEKTTVRVRPE